jgi:hypothetical protein
MPHPHRWHVQNGRRLHPAAKSMHRALSRGDVEGLARELWDSRRNVGDESPYQVGQGAQRRRLV